MGGSAGGAHDRTCGFASQPDTAIVGIHGSTLQQTTALYVCRDSTQAAQDTGGVPPSAARISTAGRSPPTLEPQQLGRAHILPLAAAGSGAGQPDAPDSLGGDSTCATAGPAPGSNVGGFESRSAGGHQSPMSSDLASQLSSISVQAATVQQQQQQLQHRPRSALVEEL
jgi:hypothetical protein